MSRRCPQCDQHLLEDEDVCWHCGARLEPAAANTAAGRQVDPDETMFDRSFLIYGALTVLVVLAALFLTFVLGA